MLLKPLILARRSSLAPASELKIAVGEEGDGAAALGEDRWAKMLPELLAEILRRVEASEDLWPARRSVVAFAGVCRRWRNVATVVVRPPLETGKITFPSALKQPGPMDAPIQCFIMRNKRNSTFYLYLSLTKTLSDEGKFLLAARRFRNGGHTEYIISLDAHDISQGSNAYVGKLRSNFLSTSFTIYDSEPPSEGGKTSIRGASPRFTSKQISPQVPSGNFKIGRVSYKSNLFRSKGPRRLVCTVNCPQAQDPLEELQKPKPDKNVVLKNKAPRWHGHLRCWCLNFHGRVTLASVKNFQLVSKSVDAGDETVLLQFGKVGDDVFTMDYQQPLSAFQAFAICLTSFGTKIFCE